MDFRSGACGVNKERIDWEKGNNQQEYEKEIDNGPLKVQENDVSRFPVLCQQTVYTHCYYLTNKDGEVLLIKLSYIISSVKSIQIH